MQNRWVRLLIILGGIGVVALLSWFLWEKFGPPKPFGKIVTIAGAGARARYDQQKSLSDPFGIAADNRGNIYVTDGLSGSLYKIDLDGTTELITDQLDMPSHLAIAPDGNLVVANTGKNSLAKVDIAAKAATQIKIRQIGKENGAAISLNDAPLHAPLGIAVARGGVYIADTYNNAIRQLHNNNEGLLADNLRTLEAGYLTDKPAPTTKLDTPCAVALLPDESLLIADTAHNLICRMSSGGVITTIAGNGEANEKDGALLDASFNEPIAIAVAGKNSFYVADAAGSAIRFVNLGGEKPERPPAPDLYDAPGVYTVAGGKGSGLVDGDLQTAQLNYPTALALVGKNTLLVADSGNGLVRAIVPANASVGKNSDPSVAMIPAAEIRKIIPPRWPYDPPQAPREIAGTLGEVRGEIAPEKDAWFHNGLDIPGAYGEQVRALFNERVTRPLAVESVGDLRERLRLPLLGYIHVKIAHDQDDKPIGIKDAIFSRDEKGKIVGIRIPRGTRINAGDIIGTLNRFNHVHLIAGNAANEVNAIAALTLPGIVDTKAPIIEGLRVLGEQGEISAENKMPLVVSGKIKFVVRAYDQVDGIAAYRKLGVYRAGYQILNDKNEPLPDYREPHFNIEFNRLPADRMAAQIAYAEPSQSGYTGKTIFDYAVTNVVRDGSAREEWLDTGKFPKGNLVLRAIVEDFFHNRSTKEIPIVIR